MVTSTKVSIKLIRDVHTINKSSRTKRLKKTSNVGMAHPLSKMATNTKEKLDLVKSLVKEK
jgi:hypothetical protein